ncbi:MAG: hypothetical protein M0Q91_08835 [Methanoregula sp.]|jgi:hypothetical protein|nr:hypothetical protein [Methanoregula sp.]
MILVAIGAFCINFILSALEKTFDEKLHAPNGGYRQSFSGSVEQQCLSIVRTFESCDSLAIHPRKAIAKRSASVPEEEIGSWGIIVMEQSPDLPLRFRTDWADIGIRAGLIRDSPVGTGAVVFGDVTTNERLSGCGLDSGRD